MIYEQFGCPPDYNPGFCYEPMDDECTRCWRGWFRENGWQLNQARRIVEAYNSLKEHEPVCVVSDLTAEIRKRMHEKEVKESEMGKPFV